MQILKMYLVRNKAVLFRSTFLMFILNCLRLHFVGSDLSGIIVYIFSLKHLFQKDKFIIRAELNTRISFEIKVKLKILFDRT